MLKVLEFKNIDVESPEAQGLKDKYKFYYFAKYLLRSISLILDVSGK